MKRIIFSLVIVLMLVMTALLAANLSPIEAGNLSAEWSMSPDPAKVGQPTNFWIKASEGAGNYSYHWEFGDGGTSEVQNPSHTYTTAGNYTVCATVTDGKNNEFQCSRNITVLGLSLDCSVNPNPTKVGHETNFTANATGGVPPYSSWLWTVNGAPVPGGQNTTHIFATNGTYTICVNATDSSDPPKKGQRCMSVTVNQRLQTPEWYMSPDPAKVGQPTNFVAKASGGVPYYSGGDPYYHWSWTIDGKVVSDDQNYTHNFTAGGTYTVCVNVTDFLGNVEPCCRNITVNPALSLELTPPSAENVLPGDESHEFTVTVKGNPMAGQKVNLETTTFGTLSVNQVTTGVNGTATFTISSNTTGTATITATLDDLTATATKTWTARVPPRGGGGGGCPPIKYLTVDWDGNNVTKRLLGNDELSLDLLGPSPDGCHSLLLEQGTHAPTVDGETYYLITIRELELEDIPPLLEDTIAIVAVSITPTGAVFNKDIILTLCFDQLPENALNGTLTVAYYDGVSGVWVPLKSTQGERDGMLTLSAAINHFTIFAVLVDVAPSPPPPAHFVASGLNIETSEEKIWETITFVTRTGKNATITANVANDGGQGGTYTVELKLDGETIDTKIVTLGAGQSQQVSFTVSGLDYGQHEVEVADLSGEFTTSRTITWWLIIVIIVAIGLIIWGVVWWRRRRRKAHQAA